MDNPQVTDYRGPSKYDVLAASKDALQAARILAAYISSRELSLAITKLEEAIMWLDKA